MAGEVRTCKYLLRAQRQCKSTHFGFECRHELVAAKRYGAFLGTTQTTNEKTNNF
jgi:hypothetical protein